MGGPEMPPKPPSARGAPGRRGAPRSHVGSGRLAGMAPSPAALGAPRGTRGAVRLELRWTASGVSAHGGRRCTSRFRAWRRLGSGMRRRRGTLPGTRPFGDLTSPFVPEAREALAPAGLDLAQVAFARQVHGVDACARGAGRALAGAVDILVTTERGLPLAISTADCLAITVCDPDAPALAVAHVGWRGTVQGGAAATVAALDAAGARVERMRVAHRALDRAVLLRGRRAGHRAVSRGLSARLGAMGAPGASGALDARPLARQRGSPGGGRARTLGHRERAPVHGLSAGSVLLVPEGAPRPAHHRGGSSVMGGRFEAPR